MDRANLRDGDIVAIARSPEPSEGDLVVARIEDAITLKRFHRRETNIELQPQSTNPKHRPIKIDEETRDWEIVDVVVSTMIGLLQQHEIGIE